MQNDWSFFWCQMFTLDLEHLRDHAKVVSTMGTYSLALIHVALQIKQINFVINS